MLPSWRSIMDELRELWHVKPLRGAEEEEQSGRQEWEEDSDRKVWEGRFQMRYCGTAKTRPFTVVGLQRFGASSDIWCIMIELMLKGTFRIMCSMLFTGSLVCTCQLSDFCWALHKPLKGQLATNQNQTNERNTHCSSNNFWFTLLSNAFKYYKTCNLYKTCRRRAFVNEEKLMF